MVKIIKCVKIEGNIIFFRENDNIGMSVEYVKALLDFNLTDFKRETFEEIINEAA